MQAIGGIKISKRFSWTGYTKEKNVPPEYKYFKAEEVVGLDQEFIAKLDRARGIAEIPFVITSGFRTPDENVALVATGAVPDSAHLQGLAVDLRVKNSREVFLILSACFSVGINRFGIYVGPDDVPTHVHLDVATDRVPEVIYVKHEGHPNSAAATA